MVKLSSLRLLAVSSVMALSAFASGCGGDGIGSGADDIVDVNHTDVERQSIGNCWLYAEATWIESMNLTATGKAFDVSQSYWTYWHWYDQILHEGVDEIETGGFFETANQIILERGVMPEAKFVKEDVAGEMSNAQSSALAKINQELAEGGRLATAAARNDPALVRKVMDDAWKLSSSVKGQLTKAFGKDGSRTLQSGGVTKGTSIIAADKFKVEYTERETDPNAGTVVETTLDQAIASWHEESYPGWASQSQRRTFQIRVQKALHDRQPVVITWDVDFNAMEGDGPLAGSFNLTTLGEMGPGRQGGHMTVMEDYQADTQAFGLLAAGVTLDPSNPDDQAKLDAALLPSSTMQFIRIKNSWGGFRDDRTSAPGFPGYHDLYLDYLNGPIKWCPDVEGNKTNSNCTGKSNPWRNVVLPPGY